MATPFPLFEGKYEIITKLKEGGMGAVYKVRHRLLDEVRVIKLIRPQLESDEAIRARFLREARTAVRLRHPNIAQFYDFSMDDEGNAFIVMEFIEGITLEEMITRVGPPPLPLALVIAEQSLQPIGYLHRRNTIHRDISPDNLMLSRNDEGFPFVKLIDLGIAKVLEEEGHSQITRRGLTGTGMFLGKVRYASPEQFHAQEGVSMDARSDLYSFGLVLYELLTGMHPIRGSSVPSFIAGHLFHPPMPFGESDPEGRIPEELRAVVLRALAKSPDARFASAEAFIQALAPIKARHPLSPEDAVVTLDGVTAVFTQKTQVGGIGSTQARLDRQFGIAPTPPPLPVSTPGGGQSVAPLATPPPPPTPVPPPAPPPLMAPEREDTSPLQLRPEASEEEAPPGPPESAGMQETRVLVIPGAGAARAAKLVVAARELVDQGRWGEALERLTTAQSLDSENTEVQALRERAEQALAAEAERARRAGALAAHARRVEDLLDGGQLEQARQSLEAALSEVGRDEALDALLERLAAAEEAQVVAFCRQSEAALATGKPDDAVAAVQQAIALRPDDEALRQLLQRAEAAIERRRRLVALLPEIEAALDDRELLTARVALDQAIEELGTDPALEAQIDRLSALVAAEVEALRERAAAALAGGDPDAALAAGQEALALRPDDGGLVEVVRQAEAAREHRRALGKAAAAIVAALEIQDLPTARLLLDESVARLGENDALADLRRRLERAEARARIAQARSLLACAKDYLQGGRLAEARVSAEQALALCPDDLEAAAVLADVKAGEERLAAESRAAEEQRAAELRRAEERASAVEGIRHLLGQGLLPGAAEAVQVARTSHGDWAALDAVEKELQEALQRQRLEVTSALLVEAEQLSGAQQFEAAEAKLAEAEVLSPADERVLQALVEVRGAARRFREAQERSRAVAEEVEAVARALDAGNLEEAAERFDSTVRKHGDRPELGELRRRLREARRAEEERRASERKAARPSRRQPGRELEKGETLAIEREDIAAITGEPAAVPELGVERAPTRPVEVPREPTVTPPIAVPAGRDETTGVPEPRPAAKARVERPMAAPKRRPVPVREEPAPPPPKAEPPASEIPPPTAAEPRVPTRPQVVMPPAAARRRWPLAAGLAAVAVVAVVTGVTVLRPRPVPGPSPTPAAARPTAPAVTPPAGPVGGGVLVVAAAPWGEVVSVRREDGQEIAVPAGQATPLRLVVPAGRYTVTVRDPATRATTQRTAVVAASQTARIVIEVRPVSADELLKRLGWSG